MLDDSSLYKVVQQVFKVRNENSAISTGTLKLFNKKELPHYVLGYVRTAGNQHVIVLLNFSENKKEVQLNESGLKILFSTSVNEKLNGNKIYLGSYGAVILSKN